MQLRPKLKHLNSGASKRKNVTSGGANATVKIEGSNEEKSVATSKKQVSCISFIHASLLFYYSNLNLTSQKQGAGIIVFIEWHWQT